MPDEKKPTVGEIIARIEDSLRLRPGATQPCLHEGDVRALIDAVREMEKKIADLETLNAYLLKAEDPDA